jgi:PAS domain S-box-containing protein
MVTANLEQSRLRSEHERRSQDHVNAVIHAIDESLDGLRAVGAFCAADREVGRREFKIFTDAFLAGASGTQALEWIPRVPAAQRATFEQAARSDGLTAFQITELGPEGKLVRAADRDVYFPVFYAEPPQGNERAMGFDLASDSLRAGALTRARDDGRMTATPPIRLVQEQGNQYGLLFVLPQYQTPAVPETLEQRREALTGFILGVYRISDLLDACVAPLPSVGTDIQLVDRTVPADERVLWSHSSRTRAPGAAGLSPELNSAAALVSETSFEVGGRAWGLRYSPAPAFDAQESFHYVWLVLSAGGLCTLLLTAYVVQAVRYTARAEGQVAEQTRDLRETNAALAHSEEKYRALVETTGTGFVIVDEQGRVLDANAEYVRLSGHQELREIVGGCVEEWTAAHDRERNRREVQKCLEQGFVRNLEVEYIDKEGRTIPIEINATVVPAAAGPQVLTLCRDITTRKQAERALRQQSELLTTVLSNIPHFVFWKDRQSVYLGCNASFARVAGLPSAADIVSKTDYDLAWKKEETDWYRQCDREVMERDEPLLNIEEHQLRADGKDTVILTSKVPLHDVAGRVMGVLGIYSDITDRKRMEEALHDQVRRTQLILDTAMDGFFRLNLDGRILDANAAFAAITGYATNELSGMSIHKIEAQETAEETRQHIEALMRATHGRFETKHRRKDGRVVDVEISAHVGRFADETFFSCFARDITDRKRMEAELRESEGRHRAITETAQDAIITSDAQGEVQFWNSAAERIFGYPAVEAIGRNILDLIVPPQYQEARRRGLANFARTGTDPETGKTVELSALRKDGSEIPVEVSPSNYRDRHGLHAVAVIRDISERRQAESRLEALQQQLLDASRQAGMAEVASGVLHNVGNVLNSLNVSATLVADKVRTSRVTRLAQVSELLRAHADDWAAFSSTDEKGRRLPGYLIQLAEHLTAEQAAVLSELEVLLKSVEHVKSILGMQQRYARPLGVVEEVSIGNLLDEVLQMHAAAFARHHIHVQRAYQDVPDILSDKHILLQILVNLVRNAKQALAQSDQAERQLTVRVAQTDGPALRIEVCDNGVGIPAENLPRIWEHGFTTKENGHGLGLANSALAAKTIGGSLEAHSAGPGQGATFVFQTPLRVAEANHG